MEQTVRGAAVLLSESLNVLKGEALVAQHLEPVLIQLVAEFVESPVAGDLGGKGQRADEHAAGLLLGEIAAVKNGHTDGEAVSSANALEVNGQSQIEHREGGYPAAHAVGINVVVEVLGKGESEAVAHIAYSRAAGGFEGGGFAVGAQSLLPIGLVSPVGGRAEIVLLVRNVNLIAGDLAKLRLLSGYEGEIAFADAVAQEDLRPSIRDQMVHLDHKASAGLTGVQDYEAVEGGVGQGHHFAGEGVLPTCDSILLSLGKVVDRDGLGLEGSLILHGDTVHKSDACAQRGVGRQHKIHAAPEGREINPTADMQRGADIVDGSIL